MLKIFRVHSKLIPTYCLQRGPWPPPPETLLTYLYTHFLLITLFYLRLYIQGPAEIPDDLATQLWVESLSWGICPWAPFWRDSKHFICHGVLVCTASVFRCGDYVRISKTTVLALWLSGYFVDTSIFIGTTVSLVAILRYCGWETSEKQRLPQKENFQKESLHLELLRTSKYCVRLL